MHSPYMANTNESSCFFQLHYPRIPCSAEVVSFNDMFLRSAQTPLDCRSDLEYLLLLGGQFDLMPQSMKGYSVCSSHLSNLRTPRRKDHCELCKDIFFKNKYSVASLQRVTRSLAIVIWRTRKLAKYNCWACSSCRNAISKGIDDMENNTDSFFNWLYDDTVVLTPSSAHSSAPSASEYWPSPASLNPSKRLRQNPGFKDWLLDSGFTGRCETAMDYRSLTKHSQTNFINQTKKILHFIVQHELAPNDAETVWKELIENEMCQEEITRLGDYRIVMHALVDAYSNATHWSTKRQILSIVAADLPLSLLKAHFPNLTEWIIRAARQHAYFQGRGIPPEPTMGPIQRYSRNQISHFIDFILSPYITTDLPFGERQIRLSTGETLLVPDVIRNHIPSRIVAQYQAYCKEQTDEDFKPLSSTSLFAILHHCAASTRKSLSGLDYFSADGSTAFDELRQLCDDLATFGAKSDEIVELKKAFHDSRNYIKLEYKSHVSTSSPIADHCSIFSLSDKENVEWRQKCDHDHHEGCESCLLLRKTIARLHLIITENKGIPNDIRTRFMFRLKHNEELIDEWKKHQIRSVHQAGALDQVLNQLDDTSVLLMNDWAMKFLPQRYREPQREFFGKRGMPWHLIYVIRRKSNSTSFSGSSASSFASSSSQQQSFEHQTFCHIFDNCTQNCRSVVNVIADVLKRLKSFHPELTTAYLRSDNAACYHGTTTLLAVEELLGETGIFVKRVDFCDPQSGKCACDRMASVTKANVRRYINERHDCCSAAQFLEAAKATKFMTILDSRFVDSVDEKSKSTWEGIKSYNNLEYKIIPPSLSKARATALPDVQVTVWRAFKIGSGKHFLLSKLNPPKNSISPLQIGAEHINTQWKEDVIEDDEVEHTIESIDLATTSIPNKDMMEIDIKSDHEFVTFDCPDSRCIRQFRRESNLCAHLIYENHKYLPTKQNLLDKAGIIYKQRVDSDRRINSRVLTNFIILPSAVTSSLDSLQEGWAIFRPKTKRAFTQKQIAYLTDKYNKGEKTGRKWDPAAVAQEMQTVKDKGRFIFEPEEFLTNSQIKSYFSRLTKQRRKKTPESQSTLSNRESTPNTIDVYDADDQEQIDEEENEFDSIIETRHAYSMLNDAVKLVNSVVTTNT